MRAHRASKRDHIRQATAAWPLTRLQRIILFYYGTPTTTGPEALGTNSVVETDVTTYYDATYPYPGNDNYGKAPNNVLPVLTGFAVGDGYSSTSFISNPAGVIVNGYTDYGTDSL